MTQTYRLHYIFIAFVLFFVSLHLQARQQNVSAQQIHHLSFTPMAGSEGLEMAEDSLGNSWIRGSLPYALLEKNVVFQITSARMTHYDLYLLHDGELVQVRRNINSRSERFRSRFPQYEFLASEPVYYLRLKNKLLGTLQASITDTFWESSAKDSSQMLFIGLYYGMALMSVVFNFIFYLIFKDKRFVTYCLLLFTTFLSFFYEDGMFYYLSGGQWTLDSLIVWSMSLTAILSVLFTYYFLGLEKVLHPHVKWFRLASTGLLLLALFYTVTGTVAVYHLISFLSFAFALLALYLAIRRFRKDVYARFLVLSFSLVVLTGLLYVLYTQLNSTVFAFFDIRMFRIVSALEIIAISFAIIFKVKDLQEENERYRNELNKYLRQLSNNTQEQEKIELEHLYGDPVSPTKKEMAGELKTIYNLTDREFEVLLCIWNGLTNKEISEQLFVTLSTTKYHVSNLYVKLEVKNRNQVQALRAVLKIPA